MITNLSEQNFFWGGGLLVGNPRKTHADRAGAQLITDAQDLSEAGRIPSRQSIQSNPIHNCLSLQAGDGWCIEVSTQVDPVALLFDNDGYGPFGVCSGSHDALLAADNTRLGRRTACRPAGSNAP